MSTPRRIQRKRTKGWRMPEGAVCVTRPGPFGNTFKVGEPIGPDEQQWVLDAAAANGIEIGVPLKAGEAVAMYRAHCEQYRNTEFGRMLVERLRGKDLACYCPLDRPCHADVLLEIANAGAEQ